MTEVENRLAEIEQSFNETVQGNSDTCKMIYEDFRSHIVIDAAQFFMKDLNSEIKAKELQLKKVEEEKSEISQK